MTISRHITLNTLGSLCSVLLTEALLSMCISPTCSPIIAAFPVNLNTGFNSLLANYPSSGIIPKGRGAGKRKAQLWSHGFPLSTALLHDRAIGPL